MKKSLTEVPTKAAQPTTMIEMNAAIRAYSIDVAPERTHRDLETFGQLALKARALRRTRRRSYLRTQLVRAVVALRRGL